VNLNEASINQNQNAISGSFHALDIDGTFSATLISQTELGDASITVNGTTLDATASLLIENGKISVNFTAPGTFTVGSSTVSNPQLALQGPNCRFTNLDVSGGLSATSHMFVFHASNGTQESVPITGSYALSAGSASFTFSGGGISGTFSGTTSGPGTQCSFLCMTGTLTICGFAHPGATATVGLFNGEWEILCFPSPIACSSGDQVTEIRANFPFVDLFCK
jgi:hypothetical protein